MSAVVDVTLCIVNYNGAERLPRTLGCVESQSWPFKEVLLIDDASEDDGVSLAESIAPQVRVLRQEANKGPGAARNVGFAAAVNDLILFIDNDVYLGPDTTASLVEHLLQHPDALLVAPRVIYEDNPEIIQYDSADCHFLGLMATRNADTPVDAASSNAEETGSVVTACFLVNRSLWLGGPPFDETFGFNMEDHDFGLRCRLLGHRLWIEPRATVLHGTGTPGLSYRPGGESSDERLVYLTSNRWVILGKCFSARTLLILAPALLTFEVMQLLWLTVRGRAGVWYRAVRSLRGRWQHLRTERRIVQQGRCVPDREVLRNLPLPFTAQIRRGPISTLAVNMMDRMLRGYFSLIYRML